LRNIDTIRTFYFIGIGGIGMSSLARYFKAMGRNVFGYDKTTSALTETLVLEGIPVSYIDQVPQLPSLVLEKENTLVVYTPAIPEQNNLLTYVLKENYFVLKRAALLGEVTKNTLCLAVAGTHGKTTTSAILGHLLAACNMPVTAFLGGIAENYNSNFISNGHEITVVEADEFDRSFLQLFPDIACITSMDADHLDIYEDTASIEEAFRAFSELLPNAEMLLYKKGLALTGKSVAIEASAHFSAQNVSIDNGGYVFDLKTPTETLKELRFDLPGHHNLFNAVTALGMAILAGTPTALLPDALERFKGVRRRFTYKIKTENLVLIDDYAHHPTEIDALFQAVSEMYPDDKKLIVFQPHLFSRTKDFVDGFARSLSQFDSLFLLPIYPAREQPVEGVTSQWLLNKTTNQRKQVVSKVNLPELMAGSDCRVKLLVGAGDIGATVDNITKYLQNEA
jgi:UDP-N-acetylmuramate--alanine ligase